MARVAAAIADPTRARTLARLLDGRLHTAGELAKHAGVTAATMSTHLKLLIDEGLARVRPQGRHRYFGLADDTVAHALEALMQVADRPAADTRRWQQAAMLGLRHARTCYGHLAGELGVCLYTTLHQRQWVQPAPQGGGYELSAPGQSALSALGVGLVANGTGHNFSSRSEGRRLLYDCVDWSERRDHFAGPLAVQLLEAFVAKGWLAHKHASREMLVTPRGRVGFVEGLLMLH